MANWANRTRQTESDDEKPLTTSERGELEQLRNGYTPSARSAIFQARDAVLRQSPK